MKQVKGSMFVEVVKGIRSAPSGTLDRHISDEDRGLISERILAIGWYPFEAYKRLFSALIQVFTGNDMDQVRSWGREYAASIIGGVYPSTIQHGNVLRTLENHKQRWASFYDFGRLEVESRGEHEAMITIRDFDPEWEAIYHLIWGWLEGILDMAGSSSHSVELVSRVWDGDPETSYRVTW